MNKNQEKWAIFWCDLLSPIIYEQIEPDKTHQFLNGGISLTQVTPTYSMQGYGRLSPHTYRT